MTISDVRSAVVDELAARGFALPESAYDDNLIGQGMNSATLVQVLSALEDRFDVDLATEELFAEPITVIRIERALERHAAR